MKYIWLHGLILFIVAQLLLVPVAVAQNFINSPNDTIYKEGLLNDLETLTIQQNNTLSTAITLKWRKVSASVPTNWVAEICDNSICYTSLVDSGSMNAINPNEYGFLLLHVTPLVNYGTAIIRYAIWDSANAQAIDTLTFILKVNNTLTVKESINDTEIKIFPNPTNDYFKIDYSYVFPTKVTIINQYAQLMYTQDIYNHQIINTLEWPNGIYTAIIYLNKKIFYKPIVIQH